MSMKSTAEIDVSPCMTLCSSILASASRILWARSCGFIEQYDDDRLKRFAGDLCDIPALQTLIKLRPDLLRSSYALTGVAQSGSLAKLQLVSSWVGGKFPRFIHRFAINKAISSASSIEMLRWLKQSGHNVDLNLLESAAVHCDLQLLEYLCDEITEDCASWPTSVCAAAASNPRSYQLLPWLRERGCPWDEQIAQSAAISGSVQTMAWLKQQGVALEVGAMVSAARDGHQQLCEYLYEHDCPLSHWATSAAARGGHLATLQWLLQLGCAYDATCLYVNAARRGSLPVLQYVAEQQLEIGD